MATRPVEERPSSQSVLNGPRFLLVRFSAIGDCVIATWAATAIRERYPDAYICWAAEERCLPVIDTARLINRVKEIPRQKWRAYKKWNPRVLAEQIRICQDLKRERFDFGIDLQGHLKTAVCLKFSYPKQRIGCHATDAVSRMLNPFPESMPVDAHWVEWQNHVLNRLGTFTLPDRPIMPAVPPRQSRMVTISTSAGHPTKVYPAQKWAEVASQLLSEGFQITFLGGKGDPEVEVEGAQNCVGRLSLAESMAMVASSELHMAGDTGTGHMAAAYGVPVVSIFGHMDPRNYRPYTKNGRVLRRGTEARNIEPEEVLAAARDLMETLRA